MKKSSLSKVRILLLLALFVTLTLLTYSAFGQNTNLNKKQHRVSGIVTDTDGIPIPGVHVLIVGTTHGTYTNNQGAYTISAAPTDVLSFSYVGFETFKQTVGDRLKMDVSLTESIMDLGAVTVNAGYYTVSEKERTGSISRITASDIEKQPVANPLAALKGQMPGVQITQQSGVPGGDFTIRIRGQNSLRNQIGVNAPLFIVDGVPYPGSALNPRGISFTLPNSVSPLSNINPNDIASIEVLKDADATAIYGSRGANGVVLITTKKGVTSKPKVQLNISSGTGAVGHRMKLLNTQQYLGMRREAFVNDGLDSYLENPAFASYFPDLMLWDQQRQTNWQKELIGGTAYYNQMQASLSGGTPHTQYLVSGNWLNQTTVFPQSDGSNRISGHMSLSHNSPNEKFNAGFSVSYTSNVINMLSEDLTKQALTLAPNAPPLFTETGELNWEDSTWSNPLAFLEEEFESNTETFLVSGNVGYELLPNLTLSTQLGYTSMQLRELSTQPLSAIDPDKRSGKTGIATFSNSYRKTWIVEPQLAYEYRFGNSNLKLLAGATLQQSLSESTQIFADGFTNDALLKNLQAAPIISVAQSDYTKYRYQAVYGRINYSYQDRYFVNLTGRRDGSSRFGPGNQFANFGAIGAAWIFAKERTNAFVSSGKLRGSFGTTGSDAIADYGYLDTYGATPYTYLGYPGLIPTRLPNADYGWETNKKLEGAIELGLIDNRFYLSAAWYRNRATDQLVGFPLPVITGSSSIQYNLPATVENRGWEFVLNTTNIKTAAFKWNSSFHITFPENELIDYPKLESSPYANRYRVGASLYIEPAFHSLGVDPDTGLYQFEDLDENGSGTDYPADLQFKKEVAQQYYGGFHNGFELGNFNMDIFLQFVKQTGFSYHRGFSVPGSQSNQPASVLNRWQDEGHQPGVQRYAVTGAGSKAYTFYRQSDGIIVDASYIRLSNLSLSYRLPKNLGSIANGKVFLQGQNLFTITGYDGLDPETQSFRRLPPLRILTLGVQFTF